jgi:hypothetical protein
MSCIGDALVHVSILLTKFKEYRLINSRWYFFLLINSRGYECEKKYYV